ncbi:MAG: dihydrofolate reductase [Erysipelotrichaceae bacterium]
MFSFSVAFDSNRGIGVNDSLPWHIKEELALFRKNTLNKSIIMGRKTFENLPGQLKNRTIYVVTNDITYQHPDCMVINDFEAFLQQHYQDQQEYIICGGSSIYSQSYNYCQKGYLSVIKQAYQVDRYFKEFDYDDFMIVKEQDYEKFVYRQLVRRKHL